MHSTYEDMCPSESILWRVESVVVGVQQAKREVRKCPRELGRKQVTERWAEMVARRELQPWDGVLAKGVGNIAAVFVQQPELDHGESDGTA